MRVHKKYSLKLLWLLPIVALAAAPFIPDLVNSTTYAIQPVGYVGSPVASGYQLSSTQDQSVFVIDYSSLDWTGDLHSYSLTASGTVGSTDLWANGSTNSAAQAIEAQSSPNGTWAQAGRKIVTMNTSGTGVPFLWSNLTTAQKTALDSTAPSAGPSPVLNYLRGDHSNETASGGNYRTRNKVLGDIIHSTPVFWDDGTQKTVFVGANDGMLHAINAQSGAELFAYIPSSFILNGSTSKLAALTNTVYQHKYFVDGQLAARKFGTQSILAGGLGGGGMGMFALDITASPASEADAASKILWEITNTAVNNVASTTYANLGHTYGTPVLAKLNSGVNALLVANGYNNTGNGHSSLFIINPVSGAQIAEIDAGTGTVAAPNGLSSPTVVDADSDGDMDFAYAGDLDGNLWKFDLTTYTSTKLYTTSPAQSITMAPGIKSHPNGGYMVTFVTGRIFEAADETNTAVHSAYGIWDRPTAYEANDTLFQQQLTETCYPTANPVTSPCVSPSVRVRTATVKGTSPAQPITPDWTAGAGHHMGWKTELPAGERVVGDGAFVTGSVFVFLSTNPTINPTLTPPNENWWMQLNAMTGGDNDGVVRFDLNKDSLFSDLDKVTVPTLPATIPASSVMMSPVGRYMGGGVRSQLTAFTTSGFDLYMANYDKNGDPPVVTANTETGVAGGHFDAEAYYGSTTSGTRAHATITVTSTGQTSTFPATLGAITVNGVVVVPALTVTDIPDGTATTTNATKITSSVTNGFTATRSSGVITITAPVGTGAEYNGMTIDIADGTSQTLVNAAAAVADIPAHAAVPAVAAVRSTGLITFSGTTSSCTSSSCGSTSRINDSLSNSQSIRVGGNDVLSSKISPTGPSYNAVQVAAAVVSAIGTSGTYKAYVGGNAITPICAAQSANVVCIVDTSNSNNGANNGKAIQVGSIRNPDSLTVSVTSTAGGVTAVVGSPATPFIPGTPAVPKSGWTNFKPALTTTTFTGGVTGTVSPFTCGSSNCKATKHVHEYDDLYDRTGVNMLNPSEVLFRLDKAIPDSTTQFKVLASNQYLSPAVSIHINGTPSYVYNVNQGYIPIKNFITSSTLDVTSETQVPTYTRANVHSLVINMPVDAFTPKNWWNGALGLPEDIRVGLHPVGISNCVTDSKNLTDGLMYQPVDPPSDVTATGNGTRSTTTGLRHNGALTIQVIKANTPNSVIEESVSGHPEYGWRVKNASYSSYVLAEYTTFWHTKPYHSDDYSIQNDGACYGDSLWTKRGWPDYPSNDSLKRVADNRECGVNYTATTRKCTAVDTTKANAATDPKIGTFGVGALPEAGTWTTTVTNADGTTSTVVKTIVLNLNGTATTTIVTTNNTTGATSTTVTGNDIDIGGVVDSSGIIGGGVTTPLEALGRVNWRELFNE